MVREMKSTEISARNYKLVAIGLLAFTAILLAGMAGLTWAVVATLKDTKVCFNG